MTDTAHLAYLNAPPFDVLSPAQKHSLHKKSQLVYLDGKQALPTAWQGDFFIIIKGQMQQFLADELIAGLNTGDWFASLDKDGTPYHFITQEQSLLYRLDGRTIGQLSQDNPTLQNLLFADLSQRVAQYQSRQDHYENQQLLHQAISSLGQHIKEPHFVPAAATLYEATAAIMSYDAKHILVRDDNRIGMFTQADVCRAIIAKKDFEATSVLEFTNFKLQTIHENNDLSEALLAMLERRIHRLPIVNDSGEITGILGQTELLHFLTNHSALIVAKIEQAHTLHDVAVAVEMVGKFIRNAQRTGTKTHVIGRTVQSLNAQIFAKVWAIITPKDVYDNTALFVMGSEGRGEQIMRTDQDNALIVRDGFVCDKLPQYANTFNDALAELGYPYCDGGIMLNNALWRLPLSDFKTQISDWFGKYAGDSRVWLATLIDAHFVCGDKALFDELMAHITHAYAHDAVPNFINRFATATVQLGDGSHFWQKFTGDTKHNVDLKKAGIFPIVHGVRSLALQHGISATNTKLRLAELSQRHIITKTDAQNLIEALDFFLSKRLAVALSTTDKSARQVNPNTLSALERDLLKESLAVVKDFKGFITRYYRLDVFGG